MGRRSRPPAGPATTATPSTRIAPTSANGDYKEGVVSEDDSHVTFEFTTPYVIGATPAAKSDAWSVYEPGGKNGLVLSCESNREKEWNVGLYQR